MKLLQAVQRAAWLMLALWLAGCATLGGPRTITFTESDLARLLEERGPFQRRLLEVLDVRVNTPSVKLLPESNRIATEMEVSTTERISRQTYKGRIAVDYALRYDEAAQAVRLTQVHVTHFHIDNLPAPQQSAINRLGRLIAETLLEDLALYRFKASDLKNAEGKGYRPSAVTVTSRGVEITLAPINR
jgi:hypothetical protein